MIAFQFGLGKEFDATKCPAESAHRLTMNGNKQISSENVLLQILMQENFQLKQQLFFLMSKLDPQQQNQMLLQQMASSVFPGQNMAMVNPLMNQMMAMMNANPQQQQMMMNPQMFMAQMQAANNPLAAPGGQGSSQKTSPQENGQSPPSQMPQMPNLPMFGMMPGNMMMPQFPMGMFPGQMPNNATGPNVTAPQTAPVQIQKSQTPQIPTTVAQVTVAPTPSPMKKEQERKRSHPETTPTPADNPEVPAKILPMAPPTFQNPQSFCRQGAPNSAYTIEEIMSQNRGVPKDNTPRLPRTVPGRRQAKYCKVCDQDIGIDSRSQGPQRHIIQKHLKKAKLYACGYCDYASPYDSSQVANHIKSMHENMPKKVIDQKHLYQAELDYYHELCFGKPSKHASKESSPCSSTESSSPSNSSDDSAVEVQEEEVGEAD